LSSQARSNAPNVIEISTLDKCFFIKKSLHATMMQM
jgi:hypothetical protein